MDLQWWHWIILGIALALLELAVPAFFIVWFGIGAVLVGLLTLAIPMSLATAILVWGLLSASMAFVWFRFLRPARRTKAGLSKEAVLGERGLITKEVSDMQKGAIRFQKPILGSETWPVIADETIRAGERARIVDVIGQMLKVERVK